MHPDLSAVEVTEALSGWSQVAAGRLPDRLALSMTHAIQSGLFPDGMRLPPERALAKMLAVSRPTVSTALELLRDRGLVVSRQGSGTWVKVPQPMGTGREPIVDIVRGDGGINLAAAVPADASHLGGLGLDSADLLRVAPLNGYNGHGLERLKALAAAHHTSHDLDTAPEQILVTEGAHHGLAISIGHVCEGEGPVAIEQYTHPGMPDVAAATGTRLIAVDVDDDGLDLDHLETVVRASSPAALVVQPIITNPTGQSMSPARLDELAELADREELTVIENNALADLSFQGRRTSLAARCERAEVISVETVSKTAWGGLRLGWLRASQASCVEIGMRSRRSSLGVSMPSQILAIRILERYQELVDQRRRSLQTRSRRMMTLLASRLPEWRPSVPVGGLSLWLRLPVADTRDFVSEASGHGVSLLAGSLATPAGVEDPHVRLCYDRPDREITVGVERLGRAWRSYLEHGG